MYSHHSADSIDATFVSSTTPHRIPRTSGPQPLASYPAARMAHPANPSNLEPKIQVEPSQMPAEGVSSGCGEAT